MLSRFEEILFGGLVEPYDDLYLPDVAFFWYTLTLLDGDEDLVFDRVGFVSDTECMPAEHEFDPWQDVLENLGICNMFGIEGPASASPVLAWGLQNGILPDQEFLVMITRPQWVRVGWEYVEYDIEFDVEVARILPAVPGISGVRELERDLNRMACNRREAAERREELARRAARTPRQRPMLSTFEVLYGR